MPEHGDEAEGLVEDEQASVTPIRPSGAVSTTIATREKLCSCSMSTVSTTSASSGTPAMTDSCPLALSSTAPPVSMR